MIFDIDSKFLNKLLFRHRLACLYSFCEETKSNNNAFANHCDYKKSPIMKKERGKRLIKREVSDLFCECHSRN